MNSVGTLFLIPSVIAENTSDAAIPPANLVLINSIDHFIVEEERTSRRFLKSIGYCKPLNDLKLSVMNEHTDPSEISDFIKPLTEGFNVGLVSEAGCPCIADPGSQIVSLCHKNHIPVKPMTGPSSVFMALMASGFNGQCFAFNGYLPVDKNARRKKIKDLEQRVSKDNQTQIFMETPYRNNALLEDILQCCSGETMLCIASEIMSEHEFIRTQSISNWKRNIPSLHKKTAIFLIGN